MSEYFRLESETLTVRVFHENESIILESNHGSYWLKMDEGAAKALAEWILKQLEDGEA